MFLAYANGHILRLHTDGHRFPGGNRQRHCNPYSLPDAHKNSVYHYAHAVPSSPAARDWS